MHSDIITWSLGVHCGVRSRDGDSSPQTKVMVYAILQYSTFLSCRALPPHLRGAAAAGGVTSLKGYFSSSSLRM